VLPAAVRFIRVDNRDVKMTWRRSFGAEEVLEGENDDLYNNVVAYMKKHRGPLRSDMDRKSAKMAHKLTNFIIWFARTKYAFGIQLVYGDGSIPAIHAMINQTQHPISDIIDSYTLARYTYFVSAYGGREILSEGNTERSERLRKERAQLVANFAGASAAKAAIAAVNIEEGEPDDVEDDDVDDDWDGIGFRSSRWLSKTSTILQTYYYTVELNETEWLEYYHYGETRDKRVLVDDTETGVFIGAGALRTVPDLEAEHDDLHDTGSGLNSDVVDKLNFFVFVRRWKENADQQLNRVRREIRTWRSMQKQEPFQGPEMIDERPVFIA
jgi:hypothetical protein